MVLELSAVPANRAEVDIDNPRELRWWTRRFACSEAQLRDAVCQVGTSAAHVEQLLDGQELAFNA